MSDFSPQCAPKRKPANYPQEDRWGPRSGLHRVRRLSNQLV